MQFLIFCCHTGHHKAIRRNLSKAKELVLFVGGLKCNLSSDQYFSYATQCACGGKNIIDSLLP